LEVITFSGGRSVTAEAVSDAGVTPAFFQCKHCIPAAMA
jgi:hypothetical protein